jgi:hypothetical protein
MSRKARLILFHPLTVLGLAALIVRRGTSSSPSLRAYP